MLKTDKIQLIVGVDTSEGVRNIGYLQAEYQRILEAQRRTNSFTETQALGNALGVLKDKLAEARKEYGLAAMNAKELSQYQRELAAQKSNYTPNTDQYNEVSAELEKVTQKIKDVKSNSEAVEQEQTKLRAELQKTIDDFGTEALSVKQLQTLQGIMFAEMTRGARSGSIANSEHAASYRQVVAALAKAESETSKNTIIEKVNTQAINAAVKANGLKSLSLIDMKAYHKALTAEIENSAEHESEINKQRILEAQEVDAVIKKRETDIKGASGFLDIIKSQLPAALIGGIAGGIAGFATEQIGNLISGVVAKFSEGIEYIKQKARDITEIQTTLNIGIGAATRFNSALGKIDTERPREQLKELILVGGDLNIANEEMIDFVKNSDKLELVLSRDFGGAIGTATTMLAKLSGTFKETKDLNVNEAFNKIGSSIKTLNEAGPASTKGIVDFLTRIGQLPSALKPAITDAAALGAVFEEANITAEIASGGVSRILITASQEGEIFGKVFKMAKKDFLDFLTANPTKFLTQLGEKVKGLNDAQLGEFLESLKLNSDETVKVIGTLSDNLDKFRNKQAINIRAFNEGTRIDDIFKVFNNDGAAEITKAEKKFTIFWNKISGFIGEIGKATMVGVSQIFPEFVSSIDRANKKLQDQESIVDFLDTRIEEHLKTIKRFQRYGDESGISQTELKKAIDAVALAIPSAITEFDKYGNAMNINTGAANSNILKQRELMRTLKKEAIDANKEELLMLQNKRDNIISEITRGIVTENYGRAQVSTTRKLTDAELAAKQSKLATVKEDIVAVESGIRLLDLGLDNIENRRKNRRKDDPLFKKTEKEFTFTPTPEKGDKSLKSIQDQNQAELNLLAELTFKRDQALANEETKKILSAKRQSQIQEDSINKTIKTESRKKTALELNEKELENSLEAIRLEYKEKRQKQVEDQVAKSIEIAQKAALSEKQLAVSVAEASKDEFAIYNAKFDLNQHLRNQELANLESKYIKEQYAIKDNQEAIKLSEENFAAEVLAIKGKYISEDDKNLLNLIKNTKDASDKTLEIKKRQKLEEKALDVKEAELTAGGNVLGAKLSLLEEEMRQELSIKDLTELQKTNILRKYELERAALQKENFEQIASKGVELFGQAFAEISGFASDRIKQEESEETDKFKYINDMLEYQKEKGILTDAEYKKQKTATEKAHDKEVKKLKYEQAKNDKITNIAQATINGVQAVMKGYAQTGVLGGTALAVIMGAISALNIGRIAATPLPSYFKGGAMPDYVSNPMDSLGGFPIMAHPKEFMVSAATRATPFFAAIEPILESANRGGSIPNFTSSSTGSAQKTQESQEINYKLLYAVEGLNKTQEVLIKRLNNLEVRFAGHDYEKLDEGLNDFKTQNSEAII